MQELLRNFLYGAAVGCIVAFSITRLKNETTFKKEEELTVGQILAWIVIGFLIGGSVGAVCL